MTCLRQNIEALRYITSKCGKPSKSFSPSRANTVGVLSQKSGVSIETIRSYARMGLIPKPTVAPGGLRLYRTDDVGRITFIRRAEDLGFSFGAIRELTDRTERNAGTCADVYRLAERDLTDIHSRRPDDHEVLKAGLLRLMSSCPLAAPLESCTILQGLSALDPATTDGEPALTGLVATLERIETQLEALLSVPDSGHSQATFVEMSKAGMASCIMPTARDRGSISCGIGSSGSASCSVHR